MALGLALLGGCGVFGGERLPAPPAEATFDSAIVPGQRIGPVALGMSGPQLLQAAGSPRTSNHSMDVTSAQFLNGVEVSVRDRDNRVTSASTADGRYATADGLRVGASELEVRSFQGKPADELGASGSSHYLCYPGVWFGISPGSNRVNAIGIAPGKACPSGLPR